MCVYIKYLNAVFEAKEFPASISDLNSSLTDVNRNALSHLFQFNLYTHNLYLYNQIKTERRIEKKNESKVKKPNWRLLRRLSE